MSVNWSERYQKGETPWEKGKPHPELPFLVSAHRDLIEEAGKILVPGCGLGHDANLLGSATKGDVHGLDVAEEPIALAREKYRSPNLTWKVGDLFEWQGRYDLVFEHTCFCAIPVERRPDYAATMTRLIPPGGHLLGIFFLNPDHEGEEGPPFGVTLNALDDFFGEDFELVWSKEPSATYPGREGEGRERSMLWKRRVLLADL